MSTLSNYVARMVAAGMNQDEAMQIVAEVFAAGAANAVSRSSGALRQQRYRERKRAAESVTNRNEIVTCDALGEVTETVTKRNESVTTLRHDETHISYLPTNSNNLGKEERKKDRVPKKRNAPLRDDWAPSLRSYQIAEQYGQNVQLVEQIFRDYLKSSGKLYADYDAAFNNFIRNQQRFSGKPSNGTHHDRSAHSLTAAIRRELAELEGPEGADFALPAGPVRLVSN